MDGPAYFVRKGKMWIKKNDLARCCPKDITCIISLNPYIPEISILVGILFLLQR